MRVSELKPGDVFDIVPVLERYDIAPAEINYYELYEVEGIYEVRGAEEGFPGFTSVYSSAGGNWVLPSDAEIKKA